MGVYGWLRLGVVNCGERGCKASHILSPSFLFAKLGGMATFGKRSDLKFNV